MSRKVALWIAAVLLTVPVSNVVGRAVLSPDGGPGVVTDSTESSVCARAERDVRVLTDSSMRGRGYLFGGHRRAADFLRHRFEQLGLEPVGDGYFHRFPLSVTVFPRTPVLVLGTDTLTPGRAFVPFGGSAPGSLRTERVIDVGHGAVLPDRGVDPYPAAALEGALVVLGEEVPDSLAQGSSPTGLSARIDTAAARGAEAVVVRTDRLIFSPAYPNVAVPTLAVREEDWRPAGRTVRLRVFSRQDRRFTSQNVVARRPGTVSAESTLVVTAHYDHLGCTGAAVCFPGANDNAGGTAMLLALAEHFADRPTGYPVLFVGFAGEEIGLVGSRHFAARPPIALDRVRLVWNLDMVAAGRNGVMIEGGVDHPGLYRTVKAVADSLEVGPIRRRRNVPNSDHYPLVERGVRGLFVYARGGDRYYHHVDDRPGTLEPPVFREIYRLSRAMLERMGRTPGIDPSSPPIDADP